jgi:hypothetical protein
MMPAVEMTWREAVEGKFPNEDWYDDLDPGIRLAVASLRAYGVETFESCEGGVGHGFPEPTVRFHGDHSEGWRALAVAVMLALPVWELRLTWRVLPRTTLPEGPVWEMTFHPRDGYQGAPYVDQIAARERARADA